MNSFCIFLKDPFTNVSFGGEIQDINTIGSAHTEYNMIQEEVASKNGRKLKYVNICVQSAYKHKSPEELRFEDLFKRHSNQNKNISFNYIGTNNKIMFEKNIQNKSCNLFKNSNFDVSFRNKNKNSVFGNEENVKLFQTKKKFENILENKNNVVQFFDNKNIFQNRNLPKNSIRNLRIFNLKKQRNIIFGKNNGKSLDVLFINKNYERFFLNNNSKKLETTIMDDPYQIAWNIDQVNILSLKKKISLNKPDISEKGKLFLITSNNLGKDILDSDNLISTSLQNRDSKKGILPLISNSIDTKLKYSNLKKNPSEIPNCLDKNLRLTPNLKYLQSLNIKELGSVQNFIISRPDIGIIQFLQPVDLRNVSIEKICSIKNRTIQLYENNVKIPKPGKGLNVRARITLLNVFPKSRSDPTSLSKYKSKLQHIFQKKKGRKFISYDIKNRGKLVFTVDYFADEV